MCTAGEPEGKSRFECAVMVFELFYKCINVELAGCLLVSDVDNQHVRGREDILQKAFEAGRLLRESISSIKSHNFHNSI